MLFPLLAFDDLDPDVVAGATVFLTRVAEADDKIF